MKVRFSLLYVFDDRRRAEAAVSRLGEAGFDARLTPGDGEGATWQARAEREEEYTPDTSEDILRRTADCMARDCDDLVADLRPDEETRSSGFTYTLPQ